MLLGGAGGSFGAKTDFAAGDGPVSVAVGDFNGDSDPDLATANFDSDNVSVLLQAPASLPCTITGTPEDDELIGTSGRDVICGAGGDDVLRGAGADDVLRGQSGDDRLSGGTGADVLIGGTGVDRATYAQREADVFLSIGDGANDGAAGEGDQIEADVEELRGGSGDDTLIGDANSNRLQGEGGSDELTGGDGNDRLVGGPGNDQLDALDALTFVDDLLCGGGTDTTLADPPDQVDADCEG